MELKSFVTQALVDIVEGVAEAQQKFENTNARINPTGLVFKQGDSHPFIGLGMGQNRYGQVVEFDVSVTVSERDEAQGGVGIQVASITLGFGVSGKTEDQNSVISRLRFSVPIFLPES